MSHWFSVDIICGFGLKSVRYMTCFFFPQINRVLKLNYSDITAGTDVTSEDGDQHCLQYAFLLLNDFTIKS